MANSANIIGNNNLVLQGFENSPVTINHHPTTKLPKDLTLKIPKIHLNDVIGRESELEDLHKLLFDNQHVVVVNGLGGIGKTTLAQAYLSKYYDEYAHVGWISQSSDSLINAFVNDEGLKKNLNIDTQGKDVEMIFRAISLGLKDIHEKPNLLLIDNADTFLTQYKDQLPHQPNWHLLVTSRENIDRFYLKELEFLTPEKSLELFKTHCKLIKDEVAINDLLKTIDYHTLTIEILAKTAQIQRNEIFTLKKAIENDLKANVFINHKGEKIDKVRSYLSSIFDLSKLNENEIWLMKQFAYLPSEFHNYDLLLELLASKNEYQEIFAETLEALVAKGWILKNSQTDSYKMHIIIGEITRHKQKIKFEDISNLLNIITQKLSIDQSKGSPVDKFQWVVFGEIFARHFGDETIDEVSRLQNNLALVLKDLGNYEGARMLLEKAKSSNEKNFGEFHANTASCYSNLATVLQDLGEYENAKILLEKAKNIDEHNFGLFHPTTAIRYSNLASVLKEIGDYEGAKNLIEKAKNIDEHNFGELHPMTAIRYSNLGIIFQDLGDYEAAKVFFEKAKVGNEHNFGDFHPATIRVYSKLASVLMNLWDFKGAKSLLEKAKVSDENNFGELHPNTGETYSNLGIVFLKLGHHKEAKNLLEKARVSAEHTFGELHPTTAMRYSNLATALEEMGDYDGAKLLLEKARTINERNFGELHPSTSVCYSNLGTVLQNLRKYEGARVLLEKAKKADEHSFGEFHPTTAISYANLGNLLHHLGKYKDAKILLNKAVISNERNFGEEHPQTAMSYYNLAMIMVKLNDINNAVNLAQKAFEIYRNSLGEYHPQTLSMKRNIDLVKKDFNKK